MTNKDLIEFCNYKTDCYSCQRRVACRIFYNKYSRSPFYFKLYPDDFDPTQWNETIRRENTNG